MIEQRAPTTPALLKAWLLWMGNREPIIVEVQASGPWQRCDGCYLWDRHVAFCKVTVAFTDPAPGWINSLCRDGLQLYLIIAENTDGFVQAHIEIWVAPAAPRRTTTSMRVPHNPAA